MIQAIAKPQFGRFKAKGAVTMAYTFCCGVCEGEESVSANNMDQAMNFASENGWRLSRDHGWTHKKCCRLLPAHIKT